MALPLKEDSNARQLLATRLYRDFHAMKTYGKEPESLESIVSAFTEMLADFPMDKITAAFKLHAQRSQEFPTAADIVGIIKRNGRPPFSKEMYISISKKDAEVRTKADWQYLEDYHAEQTEGFSEFTDTHRETATLSENIRLRQRIQELTSENIRLANMLHEARMAKGLERPKPSEEQRVKDTILAMRDTGAAEDDLIAFARQYGMDYPLVA